MVSPRLRCLGRVSLQHMGPPSDLQVSEQSAAAFISLDNTTEVTPTLNLKQLTSHYCSLSDKLSAAGGGSASVQLLVKKALLTHFKY